MRRFIALILVIALSGVSLFSCKEDKTDKYGVGACDYASERDNTNRIVTYVEMCVYDYGKVVFCLDYTAAPKTVRQFVGLVNDGYYSEPNETTDHVVGNRIHGLVPGSHIQAGCHEGDGSGTISLKVEGEFSDNRYYKNDLSHRRGVISFARESADYNSGSCQFFICYEDMTDLDGSYAPFGYVVEGMSVIDEIMDTLYQYSDTETCLIEEEYQPRIKYIKLYEDWPSERGNLNK